MRIYFITPSLEFFWAALIRGGRGGKKLTLENHSLILGGVKVCADNELDIQWQQKRNIKTGKADSNAMRVTVEKGMYK